MSGVGRVFGDAVTELVFIPNHTPGTWNYVHLRHIAQILHTPEVFISLFRDLFPALRSVTVWSSKLSENPELPSWLHVIATGRPMPGVLKTIILECTHQSSGSSCCRDAVGMSEEVVGSTQRLPELLPELAELVLRLEECNHPARHAAYIWDVLPGFRNVLRFEYCAKWGGAWKPYTVLPQDVPRLLAQDTDSDSDSDLGSHLDYIWADIPPTP